MEQGTQVGRYTVLRKIATGGMAEVFLGKQDGPEGFEKPVALKQILPSLASEAGLIAMFLDEARIAARLSHPHVVQIFDLGVHDGLPYLAMEYVFGESLSQLSERLAAAQRRLPLPLVLLVGANLCLALHHAHTFSYGPRPQPIIHRDVSPQNVLLSFDGGVKLADFGVAKAKGASRTTTIGLIKGKVGYMAPEQALGEPVDPRTDLFALGILLYELVTGEVPFRGRSMRQILEAVTGDARAAPASDLCPCPKELEALLARALEKDPARRFQSAAQMLAAIEEVQQRLGLVANPLTLARLMEESFALPAPPPQESPSVFSRIVAYLDQRSPPGKTAGSPARADSEADTEPTLVRPTGE